MALIKRVYLCTRSEQQWTVPTGVTSVTMECWGGVGGADYQNYSNGQPYPNYVNATYLPAYIYSSNTWDGTLAGGSGPGGYVKGTLATSPGTLYYLYVGGHGGNGTGVQGFSGQVIIAPGGLGGYNGGGAGGQAINAGNTPAFSWSIGGGGGGGATDIRTGGNALANRILVAGGSGGAGGGWGTRNVHTNTPGPLFPVSYVLNSNAFPYSLPVTAYFAGGAGMAGWGGGNVAGSGEKGTKQDNSALAGGTAATGGTQTAGGAAGTNTDSAAGAAATAGALGVGGSGAWNIPSQPAVNGGGGGGGGYYGGGGGPIGLAATTTVPSTYLCAGGGGGGSNFIGGSFTNTTNAPHLWPLDPTTGVPYAQQYIWAGVRPTTYFGGYVRLTYVQPPTAPAIVAPLPFQRVDVGQPLTVSWVWTSLASADGPQADGGADIVYNFSGDVLTYVPPQLSTPAEGKTASYTFPAGTFTAGRTYTLKVRIYDSNGDVSTYLPTISFRTVASPSAPVITTPTFNGDLDPTAITVNWTNPNGAGTELLYRVRIIGSETGIVLDSGMLHSNSRLNLCLDAPMKSSLGSWTTNVGSAATDVKTDPWAVANCYKVTWSATTGARRFSTLLTTIPGVTYAVSGYFAAAAATDPGMAIAAVDSASGSILGQSPTTAVAATPGNWQRVSTTFTATSGSTLLAFLPQGGTTFVSYFSSAMLEIGAQIGLYFATATSKDPGVTGTFSTPADGFLVTAASDILTWSGTWPDGSEPCQVVVSISTTTSIDTFVSAGQVANMNRLPPGTPTGTVVANPTLGCNTLSITLVDTPNPTVSADIYRKVLGAPSSTEIRIAHIPRGSSATFVYNDYAIASDVTYQYRVKANSLFGGFKSLT